MSNGFDNTQFVSATTARVAGRDYHETHLDSARWLPDAQQDRLALESEIAFREIYSFSALPRARSWFLNYKNENHLTQEEVRRLAAAAVFNPKEDAVEVRTSWSQWLTGWLLIYGTLVYGLLLLIEIQVSGAETWRKVLGEWAVLGVFSGIAWAVHWYCVWPYTRLRRTKHKPAAP